MPGPMPLVAVRCRRSLPGLGATLLACAAVGLSSGATPAGAAATCPGADTAFGRITQAQAEFSVVCVGNAARAAVGQRPLAIDARLGLAARRHAQDMADRRYFEHEAPAPAPFGIDVAARATAAGYPFRFLGENLASGQSTPRTVVTAWLRSRGHCDNLLEPGYAEIGVGRAARARVWVQVLGNRADPGTTTPYAGCDAGSPPSVADVVAAPPADPPASSRAPADAGVTIRSVRRSGSRWTVRLRGARATGRTATVAIHGTARECVTPSDGPKRCSTVPGKRLATRRATLRAATTAAVRRASGGRFVRVTVPAFTRGGVRYGATVLVRRLPG